MTTTHTNLALVEGEVMILTKENLKDCIWYIDDSGLLRKNMLPGDDDYWSIRQNYEGVLFSTSKLHSVIQLDRKWFVKPKVDIEELASTYIHEKDLYDHNFMDSGVEDIIKAAFEEGINYNAKEAEFTRGEMFSLVVAVQNKEVVSYDDFENYMNKIRPLSLPKSVTLNENNEVIAVEWQ